MNRHERRKAERAERMKKGHSAFYENYVRNLPVVPPGTPLERGRVYHQVFQHDDWCGIYSGSACNCSPIESLHAEPRRS